MSESKRPSRVTEVNAENVGTVRIRRRTMLNPGEKKDDSVRAGTLLNQEGASEIQYWKPLDLPKDTILEGDYIVQDRVVPADQTGEADVYLCIKDNHNYVAKIFRRPDSCDEKLLQKLQSINNPHIAKIHFAGTVRDRSFHIFDYYSSGSLADRLADGKKFSAFELKNAIIPSLNEALNSLHSMGILHRDIKPSNIMLTGLGDLVLIDFGISSSTRDGLLTKITKARFTKGYQAPEVNYEDEYHASSDYYSLGIVIYELFCGTLPSANERLHIKQPDRMPDDIYKLILGLTFYYYESDGDDPRNKRWGYQEVCNWLAGKEQYVPSISGTVEEEDDQTLNPPLTIDSKTYHSMDALCNYMATHWAVGKGLVFRGTLSRALSQQTNKQQGSWIIALDNCQASSQEQQDDNYTELLYNLSPALSSCVIGESAGPNQPMEPKDLQSFGKFAMDEITSNKNLPNLYTVLDRLMRQRRFSKIAELADRDSFDAISRIEEKYNVLNERTTNFSYGCECLYCHLVYVLSKDDTLHLENCEEFTSIDQLISKLKQLSSGDCKQLYKYCENLLISSKKMQPLLYGWLASHGCEPEGAEWLI